MSNCWTSYCYDNLKRKSINVKINNMLFIFLWQWIYHRPIWIARWCPSWCILRTFISQIILGLNVPKLAFDGVCPSGDNWSLLSNPVSDLKLRRFEFSSHTISEESGSPTYSQSNFPVAHTSPHAKSLSLTWQDWTASLYRLSSAY